MRRISVLLAIILASAFAQKTLFTQPIGEDTFRIKADACLWTRGWYANTDTPARTENTFGRAYGFVGATVQYGRLAYARYYYDLGEISGKPAYDLYGGVTWQGLDFRFGQLKLPLGYEVICAPWKMDLIENSALAAYRTPTGATRDIGALLTYNHKYLQPSIGVVNGNGRNMVKDNNQFLDLAGRLAITPLGKPSLTIAASGYLGNDTFARKNAERPFTRVGAEALWSQPSYFVRGEYLWGRDTMGTSVWFHPPVGDSALVPTGRMLNGFYVAGGFRAGAIQPVIRVERFTIYGKATNVLSFGANAFFVRDMVKPMVDVSLISDEAGKSMTVKVMAQLQAAFW